MRTLKLTHEQIAIIQHALGIAELQYINQHKNLVELANVRCNDYRHTHNEENMKIHDFACKFADLNIDIKTGELDV